MSEANEILKYSRYHWIYLHMWVTLQVALVLQSQHEISIAQNCVLQDSTCKNYDSKSYSSHLLQI